MNKKKQKKSRVMDITEFNSLIQDIPERNIWEEKRIERLEEKYAVLKLYRFRSGRQLEMFFEIFNDQLPMLDTVRGQKKFLKKYGDVYRLILENW